MWPYITLIVFVLVAAAVVLFARIAERRHPPLGKFLSCGGARLHYLEQGPADGDVVVLLHGNGAMIYDFILSGLVDRLSEKYRVIVFDRPGFGYSSRPRLRLWTPAAQAELFEQALKQLGVERPIVLGHSWGAMVAIALALRDPSAVKGLVLASGFYFPTPRLDVWLLTGPAIPIIGDLMRYSISPLVSWLILPKLLRNVFSPDPIPMKFEAEFPKNLTVRPGPLRAAAEETAFMIPAASKLAKRYGELNCPVYVIAGDDDNVVESEQAVRLHKMLPRSVHVAMPGGHMIHHSHADRLVSSVDLINAW